LRLTSSTVNFSNASGSLVPAPTLQNKEKWSSEFLDILGKCLQKNPEDRPLAPELLKHTWFNDKKRIVAGTKDPDAFENFTVELVKRNSKMLRESSYGDKSESIIRVYTPNAVDYQLVAFKAIMISAANTTNEVLAKAIKIFRIAEHVEDYCLHIAADNKERELTEKERPLELIFDVENNKPSENKKLILCKKIVDVHNKKEAPSPHHNSKHIHTEAPSPHHNDKHIHTEAPSPKHIHTETPSPKHTHVEKKLHHHSDKKGHGDDPISPKSAIQNAK